MFRKICVFGFAMLISIAVFGDELQLNPDHPDSYVVQKGDTLWDISGRFLTEPWRWPELWEVNPQIENPHLIYPGDVLALSYQDGRPVLSRVGRGGDRVVKLAPEIRAYSHADAIQAIPLDAIRQFLSRPRVVGEAELEAAPYVLSGEELHLVSGAGSKVYVRGMQSDNDTRYSIVRGGTVYRDPDANNQIIGYEALDVGDLVVERFGDPATGRIIRSSREVLAGDRLLPYSRDKFPQFIPHAPDSSVAGKVISVIDGVSQIGQHQIVVLNRGSADGLEPGHVLAIFQSGTYAADPYQKVSNASAGAEGGNPFTNFLRKARLIELPEERAGELMVFRTFGNVSYGLVMNLSRPIHIHDTVRNP